MALYDVGLAGGEAEKIAFDNSISGVSANKVQGAIDELKGTIGYSRKNLLVYPYADETPLHNGITWTDNGDGTITASGTSTAQSSFTLKERTLKPLTLKKGKYILSGCPQGGGEDTYCLLVVKTSGDTFEVVALDSGNGVEFTLEETTNLGLYCMIYNAGVTVENLKFYPMIRYASIEDDTYESYVEDLQTRVNEFIQFNFYQTLSSQTNKPWLEIQAQYDKLIGGRMYMGKVFCGMVFQYIGYAINAKTHASFFIHAYDGSVYHVTYINGTWKYAKFETSYTTVS